MTVVISKVVAKDGNENLALDGHMFKLQIAVVADDREEFARVVIVVSDFRVGRSELLLAGFAVGGSCVAFPFAWSEGVHLLVFVQELGELVPFLPESLVEVIHDVWSAVNRGSLLVLWIDGGAIETKA